MVLWHPKPGQRVRLIYRRSLASIVPHGETGTVRIVARPKRPGRPPDAQRASGVSRGRKAAPLNALVELDSGRSMIVPRGQLSALVSSHLAPPSPAIASEKPCARCGRTDMPIHARGLCGNCYSQAREDYPKTKNQRPFTAGERERIRREWGRRPAAAIAADLGRDLKYVYSAAVRFGTAKPRHVLKTDPALRCRLVKLHADGLSDREIGQTVGFWHSTVARWLRRIGLPSNCRTLPTDPFPERIKAKQRRVALDRIKRLGPEEALPFHRRHFEGRRLAQRMGWPQAETLLHAQILQSIFEHGPATAAAIAGRLERRPAWTANQVRLLKHRGLLTITGHANRYAIYGLAANIAPDRDDDFFERYAAYNSALAGFQEI